jgi:HSP20 family molecular chaperone IbpA
MENKMKLDTFFVGFDTFARNIPVTGTDYPRYNTLKTDDGGYLLQVALPGWEPSNVEVCLHKGVLTIKGEKQEQDENLQWIHKGISSKSFERNFKLDTDLEVKTAKFHNGMLSISLQYSYNSKPIKIEVQ